MTAQRQLQSRLQHALFTHPLILTPCSGTAASSGTSSAATFEPSTAATRSCVADPALPVETSVALCV